MTQNVSLLALTVVATGVVVGERFVTAAGAHAAAAAGTVLGVSRNGAAIGERFPVDAIGTAIVTAGGAIAAGAQVEVGANGKAVTVAAGVVVARALQAAAADGDRIEVFLLPK